jgi:hypothetical protein
MAANPIAINKKHVTRAMNRANQLDRTKCIAGNRSPKDLVGRKRIILRGTSKCFVEWSCDLSEDGISEELELSSVFM